MRTVEEKKAIIAKLYDEIDKIKQSRKYTPIEMEEFMDKVISAYNEVTAMYLEEIQEVINPCSSVAMPALVVALKMLTPNLEQRLNKADKIIVDMLLHTSSITTIAVDEQGKPVL